MNKKTCFSSVLLAFAALQFCASGCAESKTNADPNADVRKLMSNGQNSALAEFEKVKKLNNDAAIRQFTAVLQKNPKDTGAYAKRGKAYSGNKDYDKAMADYDKAIQLDPKIADAYVGRAVIYLVKRDYNKSWENVHQAEALGGQFWPAFTDALKSGSKRDK